MQLVKDKTQTLHVQCTYPQKAEYKLYTNQDISIKRALIKMISCYLYKDCAELSN